MDSVLLFILSGFSDLVTVSKQLSFSALGFSINWWDFQISLFVLSVALPLFFTLRSAPEVTGLLRESFSHSSERNDGVKTKRGD